MAELPLYPYRIPKVQENQLWYLYFASFQFGDIIFPDDSRSPGPFYNFHEDFLIVIMGK